MLVKNNSTVLLLEEIHSLMRKVFPKLRSIIDVQQHFYASYVQDVTVLQHLMNDTYNLELIQLEGKDKAPFLRRHLYISVHAPQLLTLSINSKWFFKILELIAEQLRILRDNLSNIMNRLYVSLSKLRVFKEVFGMVVTYDSTDPFNFGYEDPIWNRLWQFAQRKLPGPPEEIDKSIKSLYEKLEIVTATKYFSWGVKTPLLREIVQAGSGVYFFLNKKQRYKNNLIFKNHIDAEMGRSFWNSAQQGIVKHLMNFIYPGLEYVNKIYLDDSFPKVTQEGILNWIKKQTSGLVLTPPKDMKSRQPEFIYNQKKIRVRVMCSQYLERSKDIYRRQRQSNFDTIIYHIHGGGQFLNQRRFVALTSRTHQSYTRKWAKQCKVPVFSIDYKKAPQFPYPYALDDSWQTYNWLLYESHKYFRIKKNKRIILAGDSAGGNLIIGVTNLCLMTGTRLPIAIVPFYPCVSFSIKTFTPSYIHIINNPMIPYEFLLFCAQAYIKREEFDNEVDFLLQPIYTPSQLLSKFPPIRMYQGQADPLHDSSVKFALKAQQAGSKIQLTLYQHMIHGFLSLDLIANTGVKYANKCVEQSIRVLNQLIDSQL